MGSLSKVKDYLALTTACIGGKLKFKKARDLPKVIQGVNDKAGTKARSPTSQGMGRSQEENMSLIWECGKERKRHLCPLP